MGNLRRESGAAAVEFAVILPVLILLIVGITEFGQAFSKQISLAAAAREGVRVMAIQSANPATAATAQITAKNAAVSAAPSVKAPTLAASHIAITPASCVGQPAGTQVTMTITYPHDFDTMFFSPAITLTSKGVMQCGG